MNYVRLMKAYIFMITFDISFVNNKFFYNYLVLLTSQICHAIIQLIKEAYYVY